MKPAWYGAPMLLCLAIHFRALRTWFVNDDFAWLSLRLQVHGFRDLLDVLFTPMAQGTVRVFSERLYFLVFSSVFGLHAPPFRAWVFLTQFASIALLVWIARRLTGSPIAGFLAPILWSANGSLALAMSWSAAYNEILVSFFLLVDFFCFLKYIDTGRRRWWIFQWIAFLLGFGALELMVMYPLLVTAYALCCARKQLLKTLPLWIPSALFTVIHFLYIPKVQGPYKMYFDAGLFSTLWSYWSFALAALRSPSELWAALALTIALAAFAAWKIARREWVAAFLLAWFFLVLAPVLPLKNHITEYYLTAPIIGLAILGAWAIASAAQQPSLLLKVPVFALALLYVLTGVSEIRRADRFQYNRARQMRALIGALQANAAATAGKIVLLRGVDNDLYWAGFWDDPFKLIGLHEIYLAPGSESAIEVHPEWGGVDRFILPLEKAAQALSRNRAVVFNVVFDAGQRGLRDITAAYKAEASRQLLASGIQFIDVTDPALASQLGPGWYPIEDGFRWTSRQAIVHFAGPKTPGQRLYLSGYCPAPLLAQGPLQLTVSAGGATLGQASLTQPGEAFDLNFPLPPALTGRAALDVAVEVSRVLHVPTDPRDFGVTFGTFTIK